MLFIFLIIIHCVIINESSKVENWKNQAQEPLENLLNILIEEISFQCNKCIVFIMDSFYHQYNLFYWQKIKLLPFFNIYVKKNDNFDPPRRKLEKMLNQTKKYECDGFIILIENGFQVIKLLKYIEKKRLINIEGTFILMHNRKLFNLEMKHLWNRIINVIFVRRFNVLKKRSHKKLIEEWFNLEAINYPVRTNKFIITYCIDTWKNNRFRYGNKHLTVKTNSLNRKNLKIAIFEHTPAVTKNSRKFYKNWRNFSYDALGVEFEIMKIIADKLNFTPVFYRPRNIEIERWGSTNDGSGGLLGQVKNLKASFLLGDVHYTLKHYQLVDLSYPYNTECLTFLTPESLTENSWKLLLIPFQLYTWIAVIFILFIAAYIFYLLGLFYTKIIVLNSQNKINKNIILDQLKELKIFNEAGNSLLYTYSMLLQVSLPKIPKVWAIRVLIGWWWLYTILVTVAYRASMTANLANPIGRVTIDTLVDLAKSSISVGGWDEDEKNLFLSSEDDDVNKIGRKFELTINENEALTKVANGTFAYYENIHILKYLRAKRQIIENIEKKNAQKNNKYLKADKDLHIMKECVINMPISIAMDRNSPLKSHSDEIIRRIIESGLVEKWLNDVIEWSKIAEIKFDDDAPKALIDLRKLYAAIITLAIGYFIAIIALICENIYWKYIIMKDPKFDKYQLDIYYSNQFQRKI